MIARGNIAQIQKQEKMLKEIAELSKEMPLVLAQQVEDQTHNITNKIECCCTLCCTCCLAGCTEVTLELKGDEMETKTKNNCIDSKVRMPYAQMGSVDYNKSCWCCYSVNGISPGFGCDSAFVQKLS